MHLSDTNSRIALPKLSLVILIRHYHGISHNSGSKVTYTIDRLYCIQDTAKMVKLILDSFLICAKTNATRRVTISRSAFSVPSNRLFSYASSRKSKIHVNYRR